MMQKLLKNKLVYSLSGCTAFGLAEEYLVPVPVLLS
jgi:hypothetical protein